ncbi:hypothetical protein LCGC14_1924900 [marine sediment metagenome]|uniref:ERCC4 domain-containing protein n=1 Tax=marine sediment metagenome TaxID=412755 RepID=A0A0F9GD43_9ZZZZ
MIFVDIYEPTQIEALLKQTVETTRMTLNHSPEGYADYLFFACDGHRIQVERKQIDEILSDLDGTEEQLGREVSNGVEETILIYEGTCEPIPGLKMAVQSFKLAKGGKVMVPSHKYNISYTGLQAWFSQLDKAGITVVHTCHYIGTAMTLVALYNNAQKQEHTTLRRYIKEHIVVKPFNEHVITLMGIKGANLGEARAKALIERYGTVWYTLSQSIEEIAETIVGEKKLGMAVAKKLHKAIGR